MSLLEKNLNELNRKNPQLVKKILEHSEITSEFEIQEAKSGDALLFKNGVSIHNEIDPENEAIEHFQSIRNNVSTSMNIIYGLGLGYILKRFAKSAKGQIIVYERDLDVLRLVLEFVDFSEELAMFI